MARQSKKQDKPLTTAQRLSSIVKSCRDIMRKDKGLNGDLDRLPMLTWIMFLKFMDDMEHIQQTEAALFKRDYVPLLQKPYRWRDWAANPKGLSGDDLMAFINNDEVIHPLYERNEQGVPKRIAGLFAYLRNLPHYSHSPRAAVVASVFKGLSNRMESGYLLRDVINKINEIHFESSEEIHVLGQLYESMLREMRDAAGDSGEFYTPRPVVRFMVEMVAPQIGDTVLDPACGTGGFLVGAYEYLRQQNPRMSAEQSEVLNHRTLYGGEAKSLPYLLAQMNLLLHGVQQPNITAGNSLNVSLTEIGDNERVDVIVTNPPFGGEEERSIPDKFTHRTSETALLFLQLIMRKLRRTPRPGRAAIVVPNGTLFADGVAARIKEDLLKAFNLHTIVRLPNGVFSPYTSIPTNLLFFEYGGPTESIWYYELPLPEGRKNYTKTQPLTYEEFAEVKAWWRDRSENERAWRVKAADVMRYGEDGKVISVNLDVSNPTRTAQQDDRSPAELVASIMEKEQQVLALLEELQGMISVKDLLEG